MSKDAFDERVFLLTKRVRRLEQHDKHFHPHGNFEKDDFAWNGCIWLFVFLFIVGIFLTFILVPIYAPYRPPPPYPPPPPPPPAKELPGPQFVKHVSPKRGRGQCAQSGEYYNAQLQMCAPQIHLPMAFDATIMDTTVQACHSFYNNSCGKWIREHPPAPGPGGAGGGGGVGEHRTFSFAHHKNQALLKQIILNRSNTPLNDFYQSCMLKNAHEAGIELKHVVTVVTENLRTHADLPSALGKLAKFGYTAPFVLSMERHPTEARLLPMIAFDNLKIDEQVIFNMLNQARGLLNYNVLDLQQRVQAIVKVIRSLNEHCAEEERIDSITNYTDYVVNKFPRNVVKFGTLKEWSLRGVHGRVDGWYQFFHALDGHGLKFNNDQDVWIIGLPYVQWLLREGWSSFELFEWRAYLEFSMLYHSHQYEPELRENVYRAPTPVPPPPAGERRIESAPPPAPRRRRGAEGRGLPPPLSQTPSASGRGGLRLLSQHARPKKRTSTRSSTLPQHLSLQDTCFKSAQHLLPGLVARSFLDLIPPTDYQAMRTRITLLAHHMRQTLIDTVNVNTWLSSADRHVLVKKLMSVLIRVAEPEEWTQEPFAGQIASDRYDHNLNLIRKYRVERNLQLASSTASLREAVPFAMPLDTVNAYYAADSNTITILAGILQLPFFSNDFNRVSEYAILGSIIGHELSHALDAHGLFWDHEGSFRPEGIISREGMEAFANRTKCLVQEYQEAEGASCPNYGTHTLSENIADVTGIGLAYKALEASSMSDRQYFYFVLAQAFCESPPPPTGGAGIHSSSPCSSDPHSASNFRIDLVFRNMPDFATTFNCAPGQRMYKEDKCSIYAAK